MKCPLVAHSSKWDRQAEQIYEKIRMERKGEGERLIPIYVIVIFWTTAGGFLLCYQQEKDKSRYVFMSKFELQLSRLYMAHFMIY